MDAVQGAAENRKGAVLKYSDCDSQAATPQCATSGELKAGLARLTRHGAHFLERKKSMGLLVCFGSIHYCTYTLRLSTCWSIRVLIGKSNLEVSFALNMLSALIWSAL